MKIPASRIFLSCFFCFFVRLALTDSSALSSIAAIALAFIAVCLLGTFPSWHEETDENGSVHEVKPFPSRPASQVALGASALASLLAFVAVMWQHTVSVAAASTAQNLAYGTVDSIVGATSMTLGWLGFALLVIATGGQALIVLSIGLLDRLITINEGN